MVTFGEDTFAEIADLAKRSGVSLSAQVNILTRAGLAAMGQQAGSARPASHARATDRVEECL